MHGAPHTCMTHHHVHMHETVICTHAWNSRMYTCVDMHAYAHTHAKARTHTHTTLVQFWERKITILPSKSPGNICTYRVKDINPECKSEFTMDKLSCTHRFRSITELKQGLCDHLKFSVQALGYIEPGHGLEVNNSAWPVNMSLKRCTDLTRTRKRWLYGVFDPATQVISNQRNVHLLRVLSHNLHQLKRDMNRVPKVSGKLKSSFLNWEKNMVSSSRDAGLTCIKWENTDP